MQSRPIHDPSPKTLDSIRQLADGSTQRRTVYTDASGEFAGAVITTTLSMPVPPEGYVARDGPLTPQHVFERAVADHIDRPDAKTRAADGDLSGYSDQHQRNVLDAILDGFGPSAADRDAADQGWE